MDRNKRYQSRTEKRKQNRFLNIAIAIVAVLILVITGDLLFGSDEKETEGLFVAENKTENENVKNNDDKGAIESESGQEASENEKPEEEKTEEEKPAEEPKPEDEQEQTDGGGPQGPWEPIGTTQSEPHQKSYDDASQDWKEMTAALSYATAIPAGDMTVLWLGNGGSEDTSVGRVESKSKGTKYEVMLQWVPEKGWKPTSVTPN